MSQFTRIALRTATYADWEAQNNNTPGGLKLMEGEVCIILADQASAAAGLSNTIAQPGPQKDRMMANTGEVIGNKVGSGAGVRWDELPINFPFSGINFPSGGGRVLGTRDNGASHVYNHPGKAWNAVFGPVYSAPVVGAAITSNGGNINGAVFEVGQDLPAVAVIGYPSIRSYPIKRGRIFEENPATGARTQLGVDETAISPNTIGNFSRQVPAFELTKTNSFRNGNGIFERRFFADVTDTRPSNEGGEVTSESGRLAAYAAFPTFFGQTNEPMPADPAARGAFLQRICSQRIVGRENYAPGSVIFQPGFRPLFAFPASYGPLRDILDVTNNSQLGYTGAAFNQPIQGLVSKANHYDNEPYLIYETSSGFNGDQLFTFLF